MVKQHDDHIDNPTRVGSGRWTGFLFELIAAGFLVGLLCFAVPIGSGGAVLLGAAVLVPWLVLAWVRPRTEPWRLARRVWLVLGLLLAVVLLLVERL